MPKMSEHLKFFEQFIKLGQSISAPCRSASALAIAMCQHIDPHTPQVIVELGTGIGAVTK